MPRFTKKPDNWRKKEKWKNVEGFEGLYQISNMGRVRSTNKIFYRNGRKHTKRKRLWPLRVRRGRAVIFLTDSEGQTHEYSLKKLVADHWLRPRRPGLAVTLKNPNDVLDCSIYNIKEIRKAKVGNEKLTKEEKNQIRKDLAADQKWGRYARIARKYEISTSHARRLDKQTRKRS